MDIKQTIQEEVRKVNERQEYQVEKEVSRLVGVIVESQAEIAELACTIADAKKKLSELQPPAPISVEV